MAVSALRRYTPPTCTLEIMAQNSPLSRWADRAVLKNVRFRLWLDGPQRSSDQHVRIEGDRPQLEMLCDQVETYVQQMLTQSVSRFDSDFLSGASQQLSHPDSHEASEHEQASPYSPAQSSGLGRSLAPPEMMDEGDRHPIASANPRHLQAVPPRSTSEAIALQPKGKLKHELFFGALATEESVSSTVLSTLELFDLASALDQYRADNLAMPELEHQGWLGSTPNWLKAAAVFVFAVGVGAPLTQMLLQSGQVSTVSSESASEDAQPQATAEREDLSDLAPRSRRDAGIPGSLRGRLQTPNSNPRSGNNAASQPQRQGQNSDATGTAPGTPAPGSAASGTTANGAGADGAAAPPQGLPPELAAIPPINQGESVRSRLPEEPSTTEQDLGAIAPAPSPSLSRSSDFAGDELESADAASESARSEAPPSLPGTVPQVNEIRNYFQQQWQPPEDLDRSLEYRLLLNANGSVQQIDPLGQTARAYSGQVGLPTVGTPFVSPLENSRPAQVRVILQPDGRVRAFLESWN